MKVYSIKLKETEWDDLPSILHENQVDQKAPGVTLCKLVSRCKIQSGVPVRLIITPFTDKGCRTYITLDADGLMHSFDGTPAYDRVLYDNRKILTYAHELIYEHGRCHCLYKPAWKYERYWLHPAYKWFINGNPAESANEYREYLEEKDKEDAAWILISGLDFS